MSEQNPYSTPGAALDTEQDQYYQPKIISFSGRIGRLRYLAYVMRAQENQMQQ